MAIDTLWFDKDDKNNERVNINAYKLIEDYVNALKTSKKDYEKHLYSEIMNSDEMKTKRIYHYAPGTGRGEKQFYKIAKAIHTKRFKEGDVTNGKLIDVMMEYHFDQIE
jgi:hypothetical protein